MSEKQSIEIFHVSRSNGTPLFLHPFDSETKLFKVMEKEHMDGLYGSEPRIESLTLFRNELYRMVEKEVRDWVADARFIPRFLMSAGAFLVTYLVLSFVVRDPIPILDEIAISTGAAILTYILLGRRDLRSEMALKKRISLRNRVDAIVFNESAFIKRIEEYLATAENAGPDELAAKITRSDDRLIPEEHKARGERLVSYLGRRFDKRDVRRLEKRILKGEAGTEKTLQRWAEQKKIDLPLFGLYLQLKKDVRRDAATR